MTFFAGNFLEKIDKNYRVILVSYKNIISYMVDLSLLHKLATFSPPFLIAAKVMIL